MPPVEAVLYLRSGANAQTDDDATLQRRRIARNVEREVLLDRREQLQWPSHRLDEIIRLVNKRSAHTIRIGWNNLLRQLEINDVHPSSPSTALITSAFVLLPVPKELQTRAINSAIERQKQLLRNVRKDVDDIDRNVDVAVARVQELETREIEEYKNAINEAKRCFAARSDEGFDADRYVEDLFCQFENSVKLDPDDADAFRQKLAYAAAVLAAGKKVPTKHLERAIGHAIAKRDAEFEYLKVSNYAAEQKIRIYVPVLDVIGKIEREIVLAVFGASPQSERFACAAGMLLDGTTVVSEGITQEEFMQLINRRESDFELDGWRADALNALGSSTLAGIADRFMSVGDSIALHVSADLRKELTSLCSGPTLLDNNELVKRALIADAVRMPAGLALIAVTKFAEGNGGLQRFTIRDGTDWNVDLASVLKFAEQKNSLSRLLDIYQKLGCDITRVLFERLADTSVERPDECGFRFGASSRKMNRLSKFMRTADGYSSTCEPARSVSRRPDVISPAALAEIHARRIRDTAAKCGVDVSGPSKQVLSLGLSVPGVPVKVVPGGRDIGNVATSSPPPPTGPDLV